MQAILLAAGMGRRLGALTHDNTKCMVPVNGQRLIDRTIQALLPLNLSRLIIVTGYKGENLKAHIGNRYDGKLKIEYVDNPIYDRTNNIYSLALAKDQMCQDDTLLLESDIIFDPSMVNRLASHPDENLALVAKYEPWMDGTMVRLNSDREITSFVGKSEFRYDDIGSYYKTVNIYKFSRRFAQEQYVPFLEAYCKAMGHNEYYEQVLRVLALINQSQLKALKVESGEKWYEIDDAQDLDIAQCLFSDSHCRFQAYHKRFGGYWRFPELLDYCYLVNPYFPTTKLKDELRSNFDTLLASYPSGQAVCSQLAAKCFALDAREIAVGNGAAELIKAYAEQHAGGRVGVIYPTFEEYPNRLPHHNVIPYVVEDKEFRYGVDELMEFFKDKHLTDLFLVNPDNPSGNYISRHDVLRLARWCQEREIRLLVDESFVDFTEGFEGNSLLHSDVLSQYPAMMVMKSISKSHGVPGLRLGVIAGADHQAIARIKKEIAIWNINSFAEYYLQIFGKYEKNYTEGCHKIITERNRFAQLLSQVPYLRVIPSQANYFLCEVLPPHSSASVAQELLERNILVSDCCRKTHIGSRQLIRLAVRDAASNDRLIQALLTL